MELSCEHHAFVKLHERERERGRGRGREIIEELMLVLRLRMLIERDVDKDGKGCDG